MRPQVKRSILIIAIVLALGIAGWAVRPADGPARVATLSPATPALAPAEPPQPTVASIAVDGDEGLVRLAAQHQWPGSGAEDDPVLLRDLELLRAEGDGIHIRGTRLHVHITGNHFDIGRGVAVRLIDVVNLTVSENVFRGGIMGIAIEGGRGVHVTGNRFDGTTTALLLDGGRDHHIERNTVRGHLQAIRITSETHEALAHRIEHNTIRHARADAASSGGGIVAAGRGHVVTSNRIAAAGHAAIWLSESVDVVVRDNDLEGDGAVGILVQGGKGALLRANRIQSHDSHQIGLEGTRAARVVDHTFPLHLGVGIVGRANHGATIEDNRFEPARYGIILDGDIGGTVRANRFDAVERPIDVYGGDGTTIAGNHLRQWVEAGLYVERGEDVVLRANHIIEGNGHAIFVVGALRTQMRENVIERADHGISLHDAPGFGLDRNIVRDGFETGLRIDGAGGTVSGSEFHSFGTGIHVTNAAELRVQRVMLSYNTWGIRTAADVPHAQIGDSHLLGNRVGVLAAGSPSMHIAGNDLEENGHGLALLGTTDARVHGNLIRNNAIGLLVHESKGSVVWDNLFDNARAATDRDVRINASADTQWNVSKHAGPNVLGGDWIGGNAWHDYSGVDGDLDGLGDTPYVPRPCRDPFADPQCLDGIVPFPLDLQPLVALPIPDRIPTGAPGQRPDGPLRQLDLAAQE